MTQNQISLHVSLVSVPDVMLSTMISLFDVLNCIELLATFDQALPDSNPFHAEIIAQSPEDKRTASGIPVVVHRTIDELDYTDIIIIPSMMVQDGVWKRGRYPAIVKWLLDMHSQRSMLCSACSGGLLLAETGLLDGREATIHWAYAKTFRHNFPNVRLRLKKVFVIAGEYQQFVMSGASASWRDLVLYLVARHVWPAAAHAIAMFMLLQWHVDGQAPYVMFEAPTDHGDAAAL
jgi:transcriptional regulator GlxA family with amidase domain